MTMKQWTGLFAVLGMWVGSSMAWATDVSVVQLEGQSPEECAQAVREFLQSHAVVADPEVICKVPNPQLVLVMSTDGDAPLPNPAALPSPGIGITMNVTGSYSQGNTNEAIIGGNIGYKGGNASNQFDLLLKGEYRLETSGLPFHNYELRGDYDHFLDKTWSLFAFASYGQDTKKELAVIMNEVAGVAYNIFDTESQHLLKFSGGVAHNYEQLQNGSIPRGANLQAFTNNNTFLSYRVKFGEKFWGDLVVLTGALWYQHILYSPPNANAQPIILDPTKYRVLAELGIKIKLVDLGNGRALTTDTNASYEYFTQSIAASPYDARVRSSIGVTF